MSLAFNDKSRISGQEDSQRFLHLVPILKQIDGRIDKTSPDAWPSAPASLGDTPSPFLEALLSDEDKALIHKKMQRYHVEEKDIWQNCNLLGLQLAKIRDLAIQVRAQEAETPPRLQAREMLVEEHKTLSTLATHFTLANFHETAEKLRAIDTKLPAEEQRQQALKQAMVDREVTVLKRPQRVSHIKAFSEMQQAIDDANDFIIDLRSEVEHDRISPNRHLLTLKKDGISLKTYLDEIKQKNPAAFEQGQPISDRDIGSIANDIKEDLRKHEAEIKKYAPIMAAVRGFAYRGNHFPVDGADLHPEGVNVKFTGGLGWGGRFREAVHAWQHGDGKGLI